VSQLIFYSIEKIGPISLSAAAAAAASARVAWSWSKAGRIAGTDSAPPPHGSRRSTRRGVTMPGRGIRGINHPESATDSPRRPAAGRGRRIATSEKGLKFTVEIYAGGYSV